MRTTSFTAPSATASAAAAVSALRLCSSPVASGATPETTGMWPASSSAVTGVGVDRDDVADQADVDRLAVDERLRAGGGEQAAVLAGQADGAGRAR